METTWNNIKKYSDIKFELFEGVAKITINKLNSIFTEI